MKSLHRLRLTTLLLFLCSGAAWRAVSMLAQMIDRTQNPNIANFGIAKTLQQQIGAGRGNVQRPIPLRLLSRAIRFAESGAGDNFSSVSSCALRASGRWRAMASVTSIRIWRSAQDWRIVARSVTVARVGLGGFGGDVATRPDSRDAPHLFGLGLKEMLADEITMELRQIRAQAIAQAQQRNRPVTHHLMSKGINYGNITALPNGSVDTSQVSGVDPDLRVKPFFHHGGTISIREFAVGAFNDEMGMQAVDPGLMSAHNGARVRTPTGMVLDARKIRLKRHPLTTQRQTRIMTA